LSRNIHAPGIQNSTQFNWCDTALKIRSGLEFTYLYSMMCYRLFSILILSFFLTGFAKLSAQNETSQWYFGGFAGLNHLSFPPAIISNTNLNTAEGMASIADNNGNLLFYTDGSTVWNQQHQVMANGTGLLGNLSSTQSALIAKQPGNSNIYYIFTTPDLYYSVVDMNLAAGMGSVTIKNVFLADSMSEKLTGTNHCNGSDVWIIARKAPAAHFHAFRLSAIGLNPTPVTSTFTSPYVYFQGYMKASPNENKIALGGIIVPTIPASIISAELFDFDNATGVISNPLTLLSATNSGSYFYGCEFSNDGTKLYMSSPSGYGRLYQWDLCAGSNTAIVNSLFTLTPMPTNPWALQLAPDGKIYCSSGSQSNLAVINAPNQIGAACNYSAAALSLGTATCELGLPNFISSYFKRPVINPPFSYNVTNSVSCNLVAFSVGSNSYTSCSASNYAANNVLWDFGDPASGVANNSTVFNPVHVFSGQGSYQVKLLLSFKCRTDTLKQTITILGPIPTLSVSGNFTVCTGQSATINVSGADAYTWSNNATVTTVILSPTITGFYFVTGTNTLSGCSTKNNFALVVSKCIDLDEIDYPLSAKVYPVPADEHVLIQIPEKISSGINDQSMTVTVFNSTGQIVFQENLKIVKSRTNIDTRQLPNGIYYISLNTGNAGLLSTRFLIDR
jgi:PKD repeat protein